jgi:Ca2+-binding RTX toxin-like protein
MRSHRSESRGSESNLPRGRTQAAAAAARTAFVEPLEQRMLMSAVKIPVLMYHRTEVLEVDEANGFVAQLDLLKSKGFVSVTLQNYLDWKNGDQLRVGYGTNEHVIRAGEYPFIATFDDATDDALIAAGHLQARGFTGVAAVPTSLVVPRTHEGSSIFMSWHEINTKLRGLYSWELASHSVTHNYLGDGPGSIAPKSGAYSQFRNTPDEVRAELRDSRQSIIDNTKDVNNPLGANPIAFIHPNDDVTMRSLMVGSEYYPLMFGCALPPSEALFIGQSSGGANGQLYRVSITKDTTVAELGSMLDRAKSTTTFTPATFLYTPSYRARNGNIIADGTLNKADGTHRSDDIALSSTGTLFINGLGTPIGSLGPTYTSGDVGYTGFNSAAGLGHDKVTLSYGLRSTIGGAGGNDTVIGGPMSDLVFGENGDDSISGNGGADTIHGGDGHDWLSGGDAIDQLFGGLGNDTLEARDGLADLLDGGGGTDSARYDPSDSRTSIETTLP